MGKRSDFLLREPSGLLAELLVHFGFVEWLHGGIVARACTKWRASVLSRWLRSALRNQVASGDSCSPIALSQNALDRIDTTRVIISPVRSTRRAPVLSRLSRSTNLENTMKKVFALIASSMILASSLSACAYAGVGVAGDKAVVARNDMFLFGILRKVSVCKVTDAGLTSCQSSDSP